jgi:hypothetical protein
VTLILALLAILFAYLAYDCYQFRSSDPNDVLSASEIAKGFGQDISHLSAAERIQYAELHRRRGVGRPSQLFGLLVTLAIACAAAALAIRFGLL